MPIEHFLYSLFCVFYELQRRNKRNRLTQQLGQRPVTRLPSVNSRVARARIFDGSVSDA